MKNKKQLVEGMVADPIRYFRAPLDVMRDRRLDDEERLCILEAWATHERDTNSSSTILVQIAEARTEINRRSSPGA